MTVCRAPHSFLPWHDAKSSRVLAEKTVENVEGQNGPFPHEKARITRVHASSRPETTRTHNRISGFAKRIARFGSSIISIIMAASSAVLTSSATFIARINNNNGVRGAPSSSLTGGAVTRARGITPGAGLSLVPAASDSGRRLDFRTRMSWMRGDCVARRGRVGRGGRLVVRASSASGDIPRRVQQNSTAGQAGKEEDPITGALHQAKNLRERLAEVGSPWGGGGVPAPAAERKNGDKNEWKQWQRVFDRVDAEENILSALEVRRRKRPPPLPFPI